MYHFIIKWSIIQHKTNSAFTLEKYWGHIEYSTVEYQEANFIEIRDVESDFSPICYEFAL